MATDLELTIGQIISKYNLLRDKNKSKSLGQNFLCDYSLLKKIVLCAAPFPEGEDIIEIGPGPCGLTRAIVEFSNQSSNIYCVEKDDNLKTIHQNLQSCYEHNRLHFIYKDALKTDISVLTSKPIVIISNLPYNVGTQLLLNWIPYFDQISRMVLMFQKEVAERIVAMPHTKSYGRLSVIMQLLCKCEKVFNVSPRAFYPPPKVTSSVVRIIPKRNLLLDVKKVENVTAICFQQRRKTILNSLKQHFDSDLLLDIFTKCEIDKNDRPENISPEKFLLLTKLLQM